MGASCGNHHSFNPSIQQAFLIGIVLNVLYVCVEMSMGLWVGSLALVADAIHNIGDVLGLMVSWLGYQFAFRKPDKKFTYGFGRVSIYATIINGLLLCGSTFWIVHEAFDRFFNPQPQQPFYIALVASAGILINGATAWALMRGRDDINIKSSMIHMAADAAVSLGVVISAFVIYWTGAQWIDPALSAVIAFVIFLSGWPLLVEGVRLSLDAVPKDLKAQDVRAFLQGHPDLAGVFDLHIWALSTTKTALSAHLTIDADKNRETVQRAIHSDLKKRFGITHVTLQVETDHKQCVDEHEEKHENEC